MIKSLSDKITSNLVANGIVEHEEQDIYTYGIHQGIFMIINVLTVIIIGLLFGMIWESLFFIIAYMPLRTYAGGYHAKTPIRCYIMSVLMIILVLLVIRIVPWTNYIVILMSGISGCIIFLLAPVEDRNKPLSINQIIKYKRKTKKILGAELIIILAALYLSHYPSAAAFGLAIAAEGVMVVLGKITNKNTRRI